MKPTRNCKCGIPGILLTVQKEGKNQGRKFWKCQNTQNAGDCGFFEWDDEPPRQPGVGTGGNGGGGVGFSSSCAYADCSLRQCDQEGHWSNDCPNQPKRPRSFGTASSNTSAPATAVNATCFKCGMVGHYATCSCLRLFSRQQSDVRISSIACTAQTTGRSYDGGGGGGGGGGTSTIGDPCYKCGKQGHWSHCTCLNDLYHPSLLTIGSILYSLSKWTDRTRWWNFQTWARTGFEHDREEWERERERKGTEKDIVVCCC
ncbi:DNA topoisomerase 3-alpha [Leucoagaricus sp. SymC.cos]|nr:DNA topoisomerase 3-alpha [Leucoagaricus sp. SymC.cos]